MLTKWMPTLNKYRIVLASQSPRRRQLLSGLGLQFEVMPSQFDEQSLDKSTFATPDLYVMENARQKVLDVQTHMDKNCTDTNNNTNHLLIIGSDTVVVFRNRILEKPTSPAQAREMLQTLSGEQHTVVTGVTLVLRNSGQTESRSFSVETRVQFSELPPETIQAYVDSGEPMDKAGSYGAQGPMSDSFIQRFDGCYANVVGFPINRFCRELDEVLSSLHHHSKEKDEDHH